MMIFWVKELILSVYKKLDQMFVKLHLNHHLYLFKTNMFINNLPSIVMI